jgi:hypothetical protein
MTLSLDDLKLVTRRFALVGGGFFVLGGLGLFAGIKFLESKIDAILATAHGGDTPVVLVGGSLTFKSSAQSGAALQWQPIPGSPNPAIEYFVSPNYPIVKIGVKGPGQLDTDAPNAADATPGQDRFTVDVSNAGSWQVDTFISGSGGTRVKVASLFAPNGTNDIHLRVLTSSDPNATLCVVPGSTNIRLGFGHTNTSCPDTSSSFDSVDLTVDGVPAGTFMCKDGTGSAGHCRIILRGPPPSIANALVKH